MLIKTSLPHSLPPFNLQLFSQEKTEEATPKKKQEAREKGQVAKSAELTSAVVILATFFALKGFGDYLYNVLMTYFRYMLENIATIHVTVETIPEIFLGFTIVLLKLTLPIIAVVIISSLAINFFQVGFSLSLSPLMPKLDRINPIDGFTRLFSLRSLVETIKSLLKVFLIFLVMYYFLKKQMDIIPSFFSLDLKSSLALVSSNVVGIGLQIGGVILFLAALDYCYQRWDHNRNLMMSKQEIKEEFKQSEGNPQIKSRIREKQRSIAMQRMMQEVPKASVVITNPTHFAIAIQYETDMPAPKVIAKGQDFMALKIKQVAYDSKVTVVEDRPLARALFKKTEIGDFIPPELYQAVATVLAYVYNLPKR